MDTDFVDSLTTEDVVVVGVLPLLTVSVLVILTRVRPGLGWPLLMGTALTTGLVFVALGGDPRSGAGVAHARGGLVDSSAASADTVPDDLAPRSGYLVRYCAVTAALCVLYAVGVGVWSTFT